MAIQRLASGVRALPPRAVALSTLFVLLALGIGVLAPWKAPDFRGSCVPSNAVDRLGLRVYDNGKTVTINTGTIVVVELVTGEAGAGDAWPWQEPVSSDQTVLKPIPLCANTPLITTIPVKLIPYKAVAPGRATITATGSGMVESFTLTVIVKPR